MTAQVQPPGRVIGQAGHGLAQDVSWAVSQGAADAGAKGEARTAQVLNALAARPGGPTVLHDLAIPIPGFTANIDHALVYGKRVLLIDSKWWRPGFYWTLTGRTFRGTERFAAADKQTMAMATQRLSTFLSERGAPHVALDTPVVLIWPSRSSPTLRTWALKIPGTHPLHAARGLRRLRKRRFCAGADAAVVSALVPLVASVKAASRASSNEAPFDFDD
ncbi:nuclease-related domain-containing protein [Pseudactinotalea sp. Z1748]|uniref:nuclease-related domain-containing protein n=1 Tax=Pseudactinotalea sp. Z1748 TaxID=3413027 RepID=UPI003C7ABB81